MDDNDVLTPFRLRLEPKPPTGSGEERAETVAAGRAYASARGTRAAIALKFIRSQGRFFILPYSSLTVVWAEPGWVCLEYAGIFTVRLDGADLDELADRIADHRITWIRQCSEPEAAGLPVAVTRIRTLRSFPSHDIDED